MLESINAKLNNREDTKFGMPFGNLVNPNALKKSFCHK